MSGKWRSAPLLKSMMLVPMIFAATGTASCSKDDGSKGNGDDPYGPRYIDTSDFKNTASPEELKAKGKEAGGYFDELKSVKGKFASGSGNTFRSFDDGLEPSSPLPEECGEEESSAEEQPDGEVWAVFTQTCTSELDDGRTKTCVKRRYEDMMGRDVRREKSCSTSEATHDDIILSGSDSPFVPPFSTVHSCEDAFATFDKTYEGIKTEFDNIFGMLVSPSGLNLSGAGLQNAGTLEPAESDDQSAVTFNLVAPDQGGMEMKGRISGGASGDLLVLHQEVDVAFDMSQWGQAPQGAGEPGMNMPPSGPAGGMKMTMHAAEKIAVDTSRKLIEMDVDSTMTMASPEGGGAMTMATKGRIAVSAGTEKFVVTKLDLASHGDGGGGAAHVEAETRLIDANKLTYRAVMSGADASQNGALSFDVIRDPSGKCDVVNVQGAAPTGMQSLR